MTKIGFIGSGNYKNKSFVLEVLMKVVNPLHDIIISGHSPRNKYNNVDIWSENWAREFCEHKPIIHPAKEFMEFGFFARNKLVASDSEVLRCFINKGQYKSGTWNTVRQFLDMGKDISNIYIYNEYGISWTYNELPKWVIIRVR